MKLGLGIILTASLPSKKPDLITIALKVGIFFFTFHLKHFSDKYCMILWIREGMQSELLNL